MLTPCQKRPWTRFTTLYMIVSAIQMFVPIRAEFNDPQIRYGGGFVGAGFYVLGRPRMHFTRRLTYIQHRLYLSKAIERIVS